jgi:uncharacterized membrane protein YkvA (DUF1232 family)
MWKRLSVVWSLFKGDAKLLWYALQHPEAPGWLKWGTVAVVLYLVSPVDFIPDLIPVLGVMDDIVLVPLAIRWLLKRLPETIRRDIERRASGKFGAEVIDVAEAVKPR